MYLWTRNRVNYVFIFEFNPRRHARYDTMLLGASIFSIIWAISLALMLIGTRNTQGNH